ncbi:MAG: hypothetical protein ACXU89_13475 [Xanthobacteraceae bacterium]
MAVHWLSVARATQDRCTEASGPYFFFPGQSDAPCVFWLRTLSIVARRVAPGLCAVVSKKTCALVQAKDGDRVRLYSRPGNNLTYRFTLIVESLARLRSRSCIIHGEAVCCGDDSGPAGTRRAKG